MSQRDFTEELVNQGAFTEQIVAQLLVNLQLEWVSESSQRSWGFNKTSQRNSEFSQRSWWPTILHRGADNPELVRQRAITEKLVVLTTEQEQQAFTEVLVAQQTLKVGLMAFRTFIDELVSQRVFSKELVAYRGFTEELVRLCVFTEELVGPRTFIEDQVNQRAFIE